MATIEFLPDRLNREPAVFRGLTATELFIVFVVGFLGGLLLGIAPALVLDLWPLIPTGALVFSSLAILLGGKYVARLKRGRPDTWLYLALEAWMARQGLGGHRLVQTNGVWALRRSRL